MKKMICNGVWIMCNASMLTAATMIGMTLIRSEGFVIGLGTAIILTCGMIFQRWIEELVT